MLQHIYLFLTALIFFALGAYSSYRWIVKKCNLEQMLLNRLRLMTDQELMEIGIWCRLCQKALAMNQEEAKDRRRRAKKCC